MSMFKRVELVGALALLSGLGGTLAGLVLTLGADTLLPFIAGSPLWIREGLEYAFNAIALGTTCAIVGPVVGWTLLRRQPIWRVVLETSAGALIATVIAPPYVMIAVPIGALLAATRLHVEYRHRDVSKLSAG